MLQGTLDVFSLDEVLGLLATAEKSGVLSVSGDRGAGSVSLRSGALVGGESEGGVSDTIAAVFELLRFENGSFSFDAAADVSNGEPNALDEVLLAANRRLGEWRMIEAIVPSLHHIVKLSPSIAGSKSVTPGDWEAIVAIGDGATVGAISGRLGLGEFDGSARIKSLVENGLVTLSDPAFAPASELPSRSPKPSPMPEPPSDVAAFAAADAAGLIVDDAEAPNRRAEDAADAAVAPSEMPPRPMVDAPMSHAPIAEAPVGDLSEMASDIESEVADLETESDTFDSVMPDESEMAAFEAAVPAAPAPVETAAPGEADGSLLMRYLKSNG